MPGLALRLALLLAAGCTYEMKLQECAILCGVGDTCPAGWTCNAGGYCVSQPQVLCAEPAGDAAAGTDATLRPPDADPTAPDADPSAPDAMTSGTPDAAITPPTCSDDCEPEGRFGGCVSGTEYSVCGRSFDGDSCLEYGTTSCPGGQTCTAAGCVTPCGDECGPAGASECVGDPATSLHYRECGNFDGDACLEWSAPIMCAPPMGCSGGICIT
jgi:hypothetical protein